MKLKFIIEKFWKQIIEVEMQKSVKSVKDIDIYTGCLKRIIY